MPLPTIASVLIIKKKNQQCQFLKKGTPTVALMRLLFITPLE